MIQLYKQLQSHLARIHQQHLLAYWDQLSTQEKKKLAEQIYSINLSLFLRQKNVMLSRDHQIQTGFDRFEDFVQSGNRERRQIGKTLIAEGKVGTLILAGGQGTRLGFKGPKGMFPISLIKNKTLFQIFAEKIVAAGAQAGTSLQLGIMTSRENDAQIRQFFRENNFFKLKQSQTDFFIQGELPFLDKNGDLFLKDKGEIAFGPNGNGFCLKHFFDSGLWDQWLSRGIEMVNVILIDNPLADPFDAELVALHHQTNAEMTLKCTEREDPQEKVGIIVKNRRHQIRICEYTDMALEEQLERSPDGHLKHRCANLSLFCFSMPFIAKTAQMADSGMPLHTAWKIATYLDREGNSIRPCQPNVWKFESFIFDVLPFSHRVKVILYPRSECFAPLKNAAGIDSPETVRQALLKRDKELFCEITGTSSFEKKIELSADFYYPTENLLKKWKGKSLPDADYIEP